MAVAEASEPVVIRRRLRGKGPSDRLSLLSTPPPRPGPGFVEPAHRHLIVPRPGGGVSCSRCGRLAKLDVRVRAFQSETCRPIRRTHSTLTKQLQSKIKSGCDRRRWIREAAAGIIHHVPIPFGTDRIQCSVCKCVSNFKRHFPRKCTGANRSVGSRVYNVNMGHALVVTGSRLCCVRCGLSSVATWSLLRGECSGSVSHMRRRYYEGLVGLRNEARSWSDLFGGLLLVTAPAKRAAIQAGFKEPKWTVSSKWARLRAAGR